MARWSRGQSSRPQTGFQSENSSSLIFQPYCLCFHYFFNLTTFVFTTFSTLLPLSSLFFQPYYLCLHYFFNPTTFGSRHSARQDNNDQEHRRQNLNQNDAQSARAESTHEGVNWHSKDNYKDNNKDLSHLRSLSPGMWRVSAHSEHRFPAPSSKLCQI